MLAGLGSKEIAYSNFFQVIKGKTAAGFVPNTSTGGCKSHGRSQPTIGAKIMLELYRKYKDPWAVKVVFDDLLDWNNWFLSSRILEPVGLVALGSHYHRYGGGPQHDGSMKEARWESGMDNSPM